MSECSVLSAEIRSILEVVIRAAVEILGPPKGENFTGERRETAKTHYDSVVEALGREAARKINAIFFQLSAALQDENCSLKVRVGRLESDLRAAADRSQNAQLWRENVLNGCPVLFEQTGVVYTLKPVGTLGRKPDGETSGDTGTLDAASEDICGNEADSGGKVVDGVSGAETASKSGAVETPGPDTGTPMTSGSRDTCTEAKTAGKGKVFRCHVCSKRFNRQLHLSKHMNTHREPLACEQCPRKFRNAATYERHLLRHEERKHASFECSLCGKTFKSKMLLKTHQVVHNNTRPFVCSTCGKAFKTKPCLRAHQVVHGLEKPHKCSECGESFRYAFALRCHSSVHTGEYPFKCGVCGKAFTKRRSLRTHEAVHSGKSFTCEVCGAGFTLQQNLKRHIRIHTGERPFKCQICGVSFVQDKLKAHMVLHGASKPFMCDLCGKTFLYNCQLQKHQKMAHDGPDAGSPGERPAGRRRARACGNRRVIYRRDRTTVEVTAFSCATCHRGFDSAGSLKRHERVHSGRLPFNCDTCGKSFLYKATFDYHLRTHSGERPFGCDLCGKTFIILHALKAHKLQHTGEKPHKCEQCGRAFRIYTNYRRHLRIHTGEKPYECEVCGVKFRQLGHVKFHMQVHTGEKPYACSGCGLGFSDSRLLKRHNCTEK